MLSAEDWKSKFLNIPDKLIEHCNSIMVSVLFLTLIFFMFSLNLKIDNSGVSYDNTEAESFINYQEFIKNFGNDNIIMLAVKVQDSVFTPSVRQAIKKTRTALEANRNITNIIGITDFNSPLLNSLLGVEKFWTPEAILKLKSILPGMNRFIADDFKTISFAVEFLDKDVNGLVFSRQLDEIKFVLESNFPDHPECHAIGFPVMRAAFERYTLINTTTFILLGLLIGTLVALYIFKSFKASLIVTLACTISSIWTAGLMALISMKLSIMSGVSLCFILIVSTTTTMHLVSKYYEIIGQSKNVFQALNKTLSIVFRPCLMCALTTSVGFASLMISPVKMIRDAGAMISVGVLCAFFISLIVTVFIIIKSKPPGKAVFDKISKDMVSTFLRTKLIYGFKQPGLSIWISLTLFLILLTGTFFVKKSTAPAFPVISKTEEAKSMAFFQNNLLTGHYISLIIKPIDKDLTSNQLWVNLHKLNQKIKTLKTIQQQTSLSPLIYTIVSQSPFGILTPGQVVKMLALNKGSDNLVHPFLNMQANQTRMILHLSNQNPDMQSILKELENVTAYLFDGLANISFNGQMFLHEKQKNKILDALIHSLILALILITILMMIQLRSLTLGCISLIPNTLPLLSMFGLMGLLKIPLDPLMIFAAIISFGLSVDDSIHFLTQLKREISMSQGTPDIGRCLAKSYSITSRALLSTTMVLFFSSLAYLFSTFDHVFNIGVLIASSAVAALFGDLVLMPAILIKVKPLQNFFLKHKGFL